jgi:hypothetical protein
MANDTSTISEADILAEVVGPTSADLSPETARSFLRFRFSDATVRRIQRLLQKNNRGTITARERALLEKYVRVGQFLDLLHAKAKLSLQRARDRA